MVTELKRKAAIQAVFALAIFFFVFLGTEYLFDNCIGSVVDAAGVVQAQNYVLGISTIGFCLYGVVSTWVERIGKKASGFITVAVACVLAICILCIGKHKDYAVTMTAGCICFFLFGIIGSAVHYQLGMALENRGVLARMVGIAYAFGVFLQFLNNNLVKTDLVEIVVLLVFLFVMIGILCKNKQQCGEKEHPGEDQAYNMQRNRRISGILLILEVFFIAFIFSTLDSVVTLVHAGGSIDIGQWPRLLLGASGLLAGFLYDIRNRKFMHVIMYCITVLSTSCIVLIGCGGSVLPGLFVFYISAGFFSVYFTAGFLDLAYGMRNPKLWAGLGRAVNNACAAVITLCFSDYFSHMHYSMIFIALVLFVIISVCMFLLQNFDKQVRDMPQEAMAYQEAEAACLEATVAKDASQAADSKDMQSEDMTAEHKFEQFIEQYAITKREAEVMQALLSSDANVQDIAKELGLSRAALYRHIANMNEKTNTKARIGLIRFYYAWEPEMQENT